MRLKHLGNGLAKGIVVLERLDLLDLPKHIEGRIV